VPVLVGLVYVSLALRDRFPHAHSESDPNPDPRSHPRSDPRSHPASRPKESVHE
jgi:hypothetical protein